MTTVTEMVNRVTLLLSQVSGENVQVYAEDRIVDMLQNTYDTVFDKLWWPRRMRRETKALSGTDGEVTVVFTALTRYEDIKHIYREDEEWPLTEVPLNINPNVIKGSRARHYEPTQTAGKIFKCYPIASVGNVIAEYRTKQAVFNSDFDAVVDFDVDLLVFGSVYEYLEDDGTNPGATERYRNKYNGKYRDAMANYGTRIIPFRGARSTPLDKWYTAS